jgi:hypothetical protein
MHNTIADTDYYRSRAQFELERAKAAALPAVSSAHRELASLYSSRADDLAAGIVESPDACAARPMPAHIRP